MPDSSGDADCNQQIVHRAWGLGEAGQHVHETTKQHKQHRSAAAPMLQRWLEEKPSEQPYNNIGSVIAVGGGKKCIQDGRKEERGKTRE